MLDKQLLKIGSVCAILGAIITQASGALHPVEKITLFDPAIHLTEVAMNGKWTAVYVGFVVGAILLTIGFVAIAHALEQTGTVAWAKIALAVSLVSIAFALVFFSLDGFATKLVANWVVASGLDPMTLKAASIIEMLGRMFYSMWTLLVFGITPLLFGVAVMKNVNFNKFFGIIPTLSGLVGVVTGLLNIFNDFHLSYLNPFYGAVLFFNLWMIAMGIKMWKMSA